VSVTSSCSLSTDVDFRTGDAFAKKGKEMYCYWKDLKQMFVRKIEQDSKDSTHPVIKAMRMYLDIAYFHPFPDGNGRCGLLWLYFILRRARIPFPHDFIHLVAFVSLTSTTANETMYWSATSLLTSLILKNQESEQ
jgi:fido (protein-threonine AMPylation protein)